MSESHQHKADQVAEDHSWIRGKLAELEGAPSNDAVRALVGALLERLPAHFALEEELAEVQEINPKANVAGLASVMGEHPAILAQAEALVAACAGDGSVAAGVAEFVAFVKSHEERETEALMDAIWTDVGGQS